MTFRVNTPLFWLLLQDLFFRSSLGKNIQIVTSMSYNLNIGSDQVISGPAFAAAAERVNQKYGHLFNISVVHIYNASAVSCDDVTYQASATISEYYYRKTNTADTCYVVAASSCSDVPGIATLSRGLNWPLFYTTLAKNDFLTPTDSPYTVAVAGSYRDYAVVAVELLAFYRWFHVVTITEFLPLGQSPAVMFYQVIGNFILELTIHSSFPFILEQHRLSDNKTKTIVDTLSESKKKSRVFILISTGKTAARILKIAAQELNMGNGEYVFINLQLASSEMYGLPEQFSLLESEQTAQIVNVFRSLIFITTHRSKNNSKELNSLIAAKGKQLYKSAYRSGNTPLNTQTVQTSYELVNLLATVYNQGIRKGIANSCSGEEFSKLVANQTFQLDTGRVHISAAQTRNIDIDIFGFNVSTMALQIIAEFEWSRREIRWDSEKSMIWPTLDHLPPPDVPTCGFSGGEGGCALARSRLITSTIAAAAVSACFIAGLPVALWWWYSMRYGPSADWWIISGQQLSFVLRIKSSLARRNTALSLEKTFLNFHHSQKLAQTLIDGRHEYRNLFLV